MAVLTLAFHISWPVKSLRESWPSEVSSALDWSVAGLSPFAIQMMFLLAILSSQTARKKREVFVLRGQNLKEKSPDG